ncbi:hypothetical protein [Collinsella tanakaei]|uniref:hypothetical protein n=1 Tax=Collinsella tanakaei TaxID=626935 RepID=UPI0029438B98|nr:hypothetical protein [Collinsella tanakaei]
MAIKNRQIDLDNHLFAELERLDDESLTDEQLEKEIRRAKAISNVAQQINTSRANSLKATEYLDRATVNHPKLPEGF